MGDVHVHTAPHAYEQNGYNVWALGDSALAAVFFGVACAEAGVAVSMLRRRATLPWRECGGGNSWWRRKFIFLVSLIPLTLLRAANLYVWSAFNSEAGEGEGDPIRINHLKDQGDWMNAVVYWYMLAVKAIFLIVWIECNRTAGYIRWRMIYLQMGLAMALLFGALGIPQYLAVTYGRICQNFRQNDYCRKYHDITASLAFLQGIFGLACGAAFGIAIWHWKGGDADYEALPSQSALRNHARNSRDSYGSTDLDHDAAAGGGGAACDPQFLCSEARRYGGVAYMLFLSLIAQAVFNIYFAWYAVGGVGLLGNNLLMTLSLCKLVAVEIGPLVWITVTVYADAATAERVETEEAMETLCSAGAGAAGGGAVRSGSSDGGGAGRDPDPDDAPPPAGAYQIE